MVNIPDGYFEDEVRDGFYVNGFMKRCWAAQMEVLSDINSVCQKHGIKWYADCGTLLGAVRHGGFIPWDDDLDICMFREDYTKFISVAEKELQKIYPGYIIRNFHNDDRYWEMLSRVDNTLIMEFDEGHLDKFHGYPFRAGIDIFPLDYLSPDKKKEEERIVLGEILFSVSKRDDLMELNDEIERDIRRIEDACNVRFDRDERLRRQLYDFDEKIFSLFTRDEAKEAVLMMYWLADRSHVYPLELFEKTVMLPFENGYIPAPAAYDEVLKIEYGDYMRIVRTGSTHDYPYYDAHIGLLNEEMGEKSPFYKRVSPKDLITPKSSGRTISPRALVANQIKECAGLYAEAHDEIVKLSLKGNSQDVIDMLEQCQGLAIQMGTLIEDNYGQGLKTVKCLEDYCELVYMYHEQIAGNELLITEKAFIDNMSEALGKQLHDITERMEEDITVKREVVFLPYKASKWKYMECEWRSVSDIPDTDVYVIPLPYYEKNGLGAPGDIRYDKSGFPEYVQVTDYHSYDFEARRPDAIYIQNPYDNDNYTYSVVPDYYSKRIREYTDELVYIPCFVEDEFEIAEERSYKSMNHYVISPGVVYADKVIVQSDHMKDMYIKKLTDFFGEDTSEIWNAKIEAKPDTYDPILQRKTKKEIGIPEDWKSLLYSSDGSERKIILYNTCVYSFVQYGDKALDKIKKVLNIFNNNEKILVIWYVDSFVESFIRKEMSSLYDEYKNIVEEYKAAGYGIFSNNPADVDVILELADAYYGDTDRIVQKFRNRKLPVMIQNVDIG